MELLNTTQAAEYLRGLGHRATRSLVIRLCQQGRIVAQKIGRDWVIDKSELDSYEPNPAGRPRMETKISMKIAIDIDAANAFYVTETDALTGERKVYAVHTDLHGRGLWIDGKQILGASQFSAGRNPREAIRKYFRSVPA